MANVDIYVRIKCPKSYDFEIPAGHYDLFINGNVDFGCLVNQNSCIISNPLITYDLWDESEKEEGRVKITTLADAASASTENYNYFKWKFSVPQVKVNDFPGLLNMTKKTLLESGGTSRGIQFIPSGMFNYYSVEESNCVSAVAAWLNWMGVDALKEIVDASNYMRYNPWIMKCMLSSHWTKVTF